jgi:hypothetical protein
MGEKKVLNADFGQKKERVLPLSPFKRIEKSQKDDKQTSVEIQSGKVEKNEEVVLTEDADIELLDFEEGYFARLKYLISGNKNSEEELARFFENSKAFLRNFDNIIELNEIQGEKDKKVIAKITRYREELNKFLKENNQIDNKSRLSELLETLGQIK